MKIGAVILSRFSSSRLPGKALMKINEKPILLYIIERLLQVYSKNSIIIATSDEVSDNAIADFALKNDINCYRGSLNNVSRRFLNAAETLSLDYATRINGDNIFVDTALLKQMTKTALNGKYSLISNVKNRTYPKGMSIEIVKLSHYKKLIRNIEVSSRYTEHVTLYLYENVQEEYFFQYNTTLPEIAGMQLALDTIEDYKNSTKIISQFTQPHWKYNMKEIDEIIKNSL